MTVNDRAHEIADRANARLSQPATEPDAPREPAWRRGSGEPITPEEDSRLADNINRTYRSGR